MSRLAKWLILLPLAGALPAAVKLPSVISDHMVLQQGIPVRIWGSADPGEAIRVEFQGQSVSATARRQRQMGGLAETAHCRRTVGDDHRRREQHRHQGCAGG